MPQITIKSFGSRLVTVAHAEGHEFEFFTDGGDNRPATRLFSERWKNNRLPLNAVHCREAAREVVERCFRDKLH